MLLRLSLVGIVCVGFIGCASVPMASPEASQAAKKFDTPPAHKSGLYIFRDSSIGGSLKKDVFLNGNCIGETSPNMFFFEEVDGNKTHTLSTESEFSPNELQIDVRGGANYFIRQYIKFGVFVGGANLELVDEAEGRAAVGNLEMAVKGTCSK